MGEKIAIIIISILTFLIVYFVSAKILLEVADDFKKGSKKRKILVTISIIPVINFTLLTIYGFILMFIISGMFFENFLIEIKKEFKDEENN